MSSTSTSCASPSMPVTDTTHSAAPSPALVAAARNRLASVRSATSDTMFTGSSFLVVKPLVARSMAPVDAGTSAGAVLLRASLTGVTRS